MSSLGSCGRRAPVYRTFLAHIPRILNGSRGRREHTFGCSEELLRAWDEVRHTKTPDMENILIVALKAAIKLT